MKHLRVICDIGLETIEDAYYEVFIRDSFGNPLAHMDTCKEHLIPTIGAIVSQANDMYEWHRMDVLRKPVGT